MSLRRSTRLQITPTITYSDHLPYPEGRPFSEVEKLVAHLNGEAFRSDTYSVVDDAIVYALFASKRRSTWYRSVDPMPTSKSRSITIQQGLELAVETRIMPRRIGDFDAYFQCVAEKLQKKYSELFAEGTTSIISQ
jgi:hypothetical protein